MEWQPINTAPKDGRKILCYSFHEYDEKFPIHVVRWYDGEWVCQYDCRSTWKPSHWMPLPTPPEKKHYCQSQFVVCEKSVLTNELICRHRNDYSHMAFDVKFCPFCGEKA